jgi:hypothetical protein
MTSHINYFCPGRVFYGERRKGGGKGRGVREQVEGGEENRTAREIGEIRK